MKNLFKCSLLIVVLLSAAGWSAAQDKPYTLEDCIDYALEHSTDIGRANNEVVSEESQLEQYKAASTPNLLLSGSQTFSAGNSYNQTDANWDWDNDSYFSLSLNSSLTLYNGAKLKNAVIQGQTDLDAASLDIQTQKEEISLDILSAYVTVMYAKEQLKNDEAVFEATEKELEEASIRREAGVLSPSDYLSIKSEYASDKATVVASKSDLRVSMVSLMQLMNMPVNDDFDIEEPSVDSLLASDMEYNAAEVYATALSLQPSVKSAQLDLQSAEIDIQLAKADALPEVSLDASLSTLYSNAIDNVGFAKQTSHYVTPAIGLSVSIPIYQRKTVKNSVVQAQIAADDMQYDLIDIKNDLRKAIEQACSDAASAKSTYLATVDQVDAEKEAFRVAEEMFAQGMITAVDFLTTKNNLTEAETDLTRAKYSLVLEKKIVEYYMGNEIK